LEELKTKNQDVIFRPRVVKKLIEKMVEDNTPALVFRKKERYLPCDLFFAGCEIENNRRAYDNLSEGQKGEKVYCYYHFNEGKKFKVCQYWYYYAYNLYLPFDNHIHDIDCVKLFVNKKADEPEYITCNLHKGRQIAKLENGKVPALEVELGGHGMLAKVPGLKLPLYWGGKEDKNLLIPPKKTWKN